MLNVVLQHIGRLPSWPAYFAHQALSTTTQKKYVNAQQTDPSFHKAINAFHVPLFGTINPKHANHVAAFLPGRKRAKNVSVQPVSPTKHRKTLAFHAACLNSGMQQRLLANLALSTLIMIFLKGNVFAVQMAISSTASL